MAHAHFTARSLTLCESFPLALHTPVTFLQHRKLESSLISFYYWPVLVSDLGNVMIVLQGIHQRQERDCTQSCDHKVAHRLGIGGERHVGEPGPGRMLARV